MGIALQFAPLVVLLPVLAAGMPGIVALGGAPGIAEREFEERRAQAVKEVLRDLH